MASIAPPALSPGAVTGRVLLPLLLRVVVLLLLLLLLLEVVLVVLLVVRWVRVGLGSGYSLSMVLML